MKTNYKILINLNALLLILLLTGSCKKLVEVDAPITSTNGENIFTEDANAISVLTSVYANMSNSQVADLNGSLTNTCFLTGLTGDELELYNPTNVAFSPYFANNILSTNDTWSRIYNMIFIANSAIEQLPINGTALTPAVKNQLLGEAKFIRALSYFYLVNLYGDVPLPVSTDYQINRVLPRSSTEAVYQLIVADLKEAQSLMSESFVAKDGFSVTTERVRPNKWTATALLARVYLYTKRYSEAEGQSSTLIDNNGLFNLVSLNDVFLMNSKEAIWQLQPVGSQTIAAANTQEGQLFNLQDMPSTQYTVVLSKRYVDSFDDKDLRKVLWISKILAENGSSLYFPYKYKIGKQFVPTKEYSMVFRLGEQYLVRAEARIQQGKIIEGIADLNSIRSRATDKTVPIDNRLTQLPSNLTKTEALLAVEEERKFELFSEWGHRWLDLKRTERIDDVLKTLKPGWQTTDKLYPLPSDVVNANPNVIGHQNPGYN